MRHWIIDSDSNGLPGWQEAMHQEFARWSPRVICEVEFLELADIESMEPPQDEEIEAVLQHTLWKSLRLEEAKRSKLCTTWRDLPEKARWYAGVFLTFSCSFSISRSFSNRL